MNRTTLSLLMAACAAVTAGNVVAAEPAPAHVVIADKPRPQAKILLYALLPRLEKIFNVTSAETKARLRSKSLEHGF